MDAEDLFRKLTTGAKFNFKKYSADAQKLKVCIIFGIVTLQLYNRGIILYCLAFLFASQVLKSKYVPVCPAISIKKESKDEASKLEDVAASSEAGEWSDTDSELTLLGSIKAINIGSKVKKKKKLPNKDLLQKKLVAQQEEQV